MSGSAAVDLIPDVCSYSLCDRHRDYPVGLFRIDYVHVSLVFAVS